RVLSYQRTKEAAPDEPGPLESAELAGCCLVAGDGGFGFRLRRCCTVAVRVAVSVAIRRGDGDQLARVSNVSRYRLRDVRHRADLHHRLLRLLQHQLFLDGSNPGLFPL